MTRKQRGFTIEAIAVAVSSLLLAVVIPRLVNSHDTIALFAGLMLLAGLIGWVGWLFYRVDREFGN